MTLLLIKLSSWVMTAATATETAMKRWIRTRMSDPEWRDEDVE